MDAMRRGHRVSSVESLAAFTDSASQCIDDRSTSDAVHGDGDGLVRLAADGAQRHAARAEALHDGGRWLHLLQGNRSPRRGQLQAVSQERRRALFEVLLVRCVCLLCSTCVVSMMPSPSGCAYTSFAPHTCHAMSYHYMILDFRGSCQQRDGAGGPCNKAGCC